MVESTIATVAGMLSLFIGILILAVCVMFVIRYTKRKAKSILYLTFSVLSWLGATWSATVIYLLAGWNLQVAIVSQKLVYTFVFTGTICTLFFARAIFFEKAKNTFFQAYMIIGIVIITVMLVLDSVDVQGFPDEPSYPLLTIAMEYSLIVVVFIIPVVLGILVIALRLRARTSDNVSRAGLGFIAGGQFSILLTFVVDTLATAFIGDIILYQVFLYATWIPPLVGVFLYYLGWIMPDWLKRRIEKRRGSNVPKEKSKKPSDPME
ncbi:MAG: hypothetical protein Q6373_013035 [Candidatus Sigynarchaeota archaeon]